MWSIRVNRWLIALAAAWINLFIFAIFRSAGVLYLALMSTFQCSHQSAAWPVSLSGSVASTVGIVTGFSTHYASLQALIAVGILVASGSVIATYFAHSIGIVTLTIGVFQGIGIGFVTNLLPAVLNQHFPDRKAVALGISYGGATFGAFFFPVAIQTLLDRYSFHETVLGVGVVSLLGVLGVFFLRPKQRIDLDAVNAIELKSMNGRERCNSSRNSHHTFSTNNNNDSFRGSTGHNTVVSSVGTYSNVETSRPLIEECETIVYVNNNILYSNILSDHSQSPTHHKQPYLKSDSCDDDMSSETNSSISHQTNASKSGLRFWANIRQDFRTINSLPFVLCTFSYINFILDFVAFIIVLPDIAQDRGIDKSHAKWLLSIFSITDFLGRIIPGWLSYAQIATDKNIYILSLTFMGLSMALIIVVREWSHFVLLTLVCGFATGCQMVLSPAILADYIGVENTAVGFGMVNFISGIVSLVTRPLIIGAKDIYGDYQLLSYVLSFATLSAGLLWLVESFFALKLHHQLADDQRHVSPAQSS